METKEQQLEKTIADCRKSLITCDYQGKEVKAAALATLEEIAFNRGYKACLEFVKQLNER
jgi:hypothetical protein